MVRINEIEYKLKWTLRGFFIYEELSGRPFEAGKIVNEYLLLYAMLLANNPDTFSMTFDEFIAECDANNQIYASFAEMMLAKIEEQAQYFPNEKKKGVNR